jgi:hypothetical protein
VPWPAFIDFFPLYGYAIVLAYRIERSAAPIVNFLNVRPKKLPIFLVRSHGPFVDRARHPTGGPVSEKCFAELSRSLLACGPMLLPAGHSSNEDERWPEQRQRQ